MIRTTLNLCVLYNWGRGAVISTWTRRGRPSPRPHVAGRVSSSDEQLQISKTVLLPHKVKPQAPR